MTTLVFADVVKGKLGDAVAKVVTAAVQLGAPVHVLVTGPDSAGAAQEAAGLTGVDKVLVADAPVYAHQLAEPTAALLAALAGSYGAIVSSATSSAKNVMPRVAAPDTFERPIYAGNAIQTVQSADRIKVITVRTTAFQAAAAGGAAPIEAVPAGADPALSSFKGEALAKSDRPELTAARIIISGGRAMQNAENFKTYIEPIADRLGAAMGASRAAVDAGYAPNDWQVGQTGKVVAPELYIAVGISGAIQHLAGMKDSKVIVAINKDEEAPIFQVADYGLVADLYKALPELDAELAKLGK